MIPLVNCWGIRKTVIMTIRDYKFVISVQNAIPLILSQRRFALLLPDKNDIKRIESSKVQK